MDGRDRHLLRRQIVRPLRKPLVILTPKSLLRNPHAVSPLAECTEGRFQRVLADQKIHMRVPLHFVNQENSPAVKAAGALVNHVLNDIDVSCLPGDLPEFIEVDLSNLTIGHSVHVKDLKFPAGVAPVLHRGENPVVASASIPRAAEVEEAAVAEEVVPASMVPAAKQQPEKPEAAAPEKGEKPGKEEKKK